MENLLIISQVLENSGLRKKDSLEVANEIAIGIPHYEYNTILLNLIGNKVTETLSCVRLLLLMHSILRATLGIGEMPAP